MNSRRQFLKKGGVLAAIFGARGSISIAKAEEFHQSKKWGMVIDLNRCIGCHSCVIACKAQNNTVADRFSTRIVTNEIGTRDEPSKSFIPVLCNHCENPACEAACPVSALTKLPNGVVVADWNKCAPDKCKPISNGAGACVAACPYNANFLDSRYGDKVDKCDFCIGRVEKGLEPACVESCSSKARLFGDMNAPKGEFAEYLKRTDMKRPKPEVRFKEYPLNKAEDYYLKGIANLASNTKAQEASEGDLVFVEKNYPVSKFKDTLANGEWKQACHVLARGGVFNFKYEDLFEGDNHKFGLKRVVLYNEELATTRNSLTGEFFPGTLKYIPPVNSKGLILDEVDSDYPFSVITYKMNLHAQSRTAFHGWAMEVFPENFAEINEKDAEKYGLKDNDKIFLISRSNPEGIAGKVKVTKLIRQGCIGVSNHYGHTQFGASRLPLMNCENAYLGGKRVVDKNGLIPEPQLGTGLNSNYLSRLDENLANTPMVDVVAGIPDFSSTKVKIIKV